MPWPNWLSGEVDTPRDGWLYKIDLAANGPAQFKVETGLFWPVLHDPKMYFCPSDKTNSPLFQMRGQQISSYVMNGAVCGYGPRPVSAAETGAVVAQRRRLLGVCEQYGG